MGIHAISWWRCPLLPFKDQATQSLHLSPPARVKYKHVEWLFPILQTKRLRFEKKTCFLKAWY